MKNHVQPGNTITLTAPYAVASGDGLLVGSIFGIAAGATAIAEPVETALVGVFDITKIGSQAWTVGAKVYWDRVGAAAPRSVAATWAECSAAAAASRQVRWYSMVIGMVLSDRQQIASSAGAGSRAERITLRVGRNCPGSRPLARRRRNDTVRLNVSHGMRLDRPFRMSYWPAGRSPKRISKKTSQRSIHPLRSASLGDRDRGSGAK